MTWKQKGFRHDSRHNRVRLSKSATHKEHPRAREYILAEYETRPDVEVEKTQQVRAVYDQQKERWELHLVCTKEVETPDSPGDETAGIDLGISNFAAVAYSTEEADLYPGNRLKQTATTSRRKSPSETIVVVSGRPSSITSGRSAAPTSSTASPNISSSGALRRVLAASTSEI